MKTHIAIIDDGINEKYYPIGQLQYNIEIDSNLHIHQRSDYNPYLQSHGTTCAAIIKKYASDAVLSSVKILSNDGKRGVKGQLFKALKWCIAHHIRLVNLSLGTIDFRDFEEIETIIKETNQCNVIIVAAGSNQHIFTYPAALCEVIGVKCDLSGMLKPNEYIYNAIRNDGIDFIVGSVDLLKSYDGKNEIIPLCNSYATPVITAKVSEIIQRHPDSSLKAVKAQLLQKVATISSEQMDIICKYYTPSLRDIDIPIILLYDCTAKEDIMVQDALHQLFRKDGYNALCICQTNEHENQSKGIISIEKFINTSNKQYALALKNLYEVYDPDVLIIPQDYQRVAEDFAQTLEDSFEIDVRIIIMDEMSEKVREYTELNEKNNLLLFLGREVPSDELLLRVYKQLLKVLKGLF